MTFEEWLEQEEFTNGCMGLSALEIDQMRMAWNAALNNKSTDLNEQPKVVP